MDFKNDGKTYFGQLYGVGIDADPAFLLSADVDEQIFFVCFLSFAESALWVRWVCSGDVVGDSLSEVPGFPLDVTLEAADLVWNGSDVSSLSRVLRWHYFLARSGKGVADWQLASSIGSMAVCEDQVA